MKNRNGLVALATIPLALGAALTALPAHADTVSAQGTGTVAQPNLKHSTVIAGCDGSGYVDDPGNPDPDPCTDLPLSRIVYSSNFKTQNPEAKGAKGAVARGAWTAPVRLRAVRFDPDTTFGNCGSTTIGVWTLDGVELWSATPTDCGWVSIPDSVRAQLTSGRGLLRGAVVA